MAFQFPDPAVTPEFEAANGITYVWDPVNTRWMVKSNGGDELYVNRKGGDSMEGPLSIENQPGMGSRDARRIHTLGVFSNSDNSALRLGTTRDRVYIGHDDTSFNGPVKVDEIQEKNSGNGVKVANDLKMSMQQIKNLGAATEDNDALPYGQFITELQDFRDDLVEDLTVGTWDYNALQSAVSPPPGAFIAWNENGQVLGPVFATKYLRFYETDKAGHTIDWSRWDIGEMLTMASGPMKVILRVNAAPVHSANIVIVEVNYISSTNMSSWTSINEWAVKLTEFADIDVVELDETYLRLDGNNGPMQGDVDFGRRAVKNMLFIDLISNGSYIKAAGNNLLRVYSGSLTTEGYAQIQVERPSKATRGFAIRGYEEGSSTEGDLLYSYHPDSPTGDVIVYKGRTGSDQSIQTKESVKALIAEELTNQEPNSGRVIITHLEFANLNHSYYANDDEIKGINKNGSYTSDRDVYGVHIPFAWFAKHHPEIIGFIDTGENGTFEGRSAKITVNKDGNRPGITVKQSENYASQPTVTIPGFHIVVDDISEDQYTHKFGSSTFSVGEEPDVDVTVGVDVDGDGDSDVVIHIDADDTDTDGDGDTDVVINVNTDAPSMEPGNHITARDMQMVFEGLRQAVSSATDFDDMREKLALKISELEYSAEFQPATDETESSGY